MHHHRQRPWQAVQPVDQFLIHALGQHNRKAGMDAQAAQVRDVTQGIGQLGQLVGGQRQRIATGQDDLVDAGIVRDGLHGLSPAAAGGVFRAVIEMPPEAVPAVDGAAAGRDQQGASAVFLDDAGGLFRGAIAYRVEAEAFHPTHFLVDRQDLAQQRIGGVAVAHAGDEPFRHAQRELLQCCFGNAQRSRLQAQPRQQLGWIADGLSPQLLPARGDGPYGNGPGRAGELHGQGACGYHEGRKTVAHRLPAGFPFYPARRIRGVLPSQEFTHGHCGHERCQERDENPGQQ